MVISLGRDLDGVQECSERVGIFCRCRGAGAIRVSRGDPRDGHILDWYFIGFDPAHASGLTLRP